MNEFIANSRAINEHRLLGKQLGLVGNWLAHGAVRPAVAFNRRITENNCLSMLKEDEICNLHSCILQSLILQ